MAQLTLQGKYNTATIYTHNIEETAIGQVIGMLNEVITENTTVAIMPDVTQVRVLPSVRQLNYLKTEKTGKSDLTWSLLILGAACEQLNLKNKMSILKNWIIS